MTHKPTKQPAPRRISMLLILAGLLFMLFSFSGISYAGLVQIAALALLVAGLQLLNRWVLTDFIYEIEDRDDGLSDLRVYRVQGQKSVKVCDIALSRVTELLPLDSDEYTAARGKIGPRCDYRQNASSGFALLYEDGGMPGNGSGEKATEIRIEPDARFLAALRERIAAAGEASSDSGNGFLM